MKVERTIAPAWKGDAPDLPADQYGPGFLKSTRSGLNTTKIRIGLFLLLTVFSAATCSDRMPTRSYFIDWITSVYVEEIGIDPDEVVICSWERTSKDITRLAPEVDGLRVEAAIFSTQAEEALKVSSDELLVHYVLCRYYRVTDEWYLHASSWGEGFWKQDPAEWGHLVEKCRHRAEQMKQQRDSMQEGR